MRIPMVDLVAQHAALRDALEAAVGAQMASGSFVLGPAVAAFEAEVAAYLGAAHAVGVASGTDALKLALMAAGVGPGDEVITSPFTFIATAEAIAMVGARPVFVDIDPKTFNIDPSQIEAAVTPRTRAVIPVHLYGQAADLAAISALCEGLGLALIEDAAQAFGADLQGKKLGTWGRLGCFSFYPSKNLGAYGDGGLVVTDDEALAAALRRLRQHGHEGGYRHGALGLNSRLDAIQAAVLRVKLPHLDGWSQARRAAARRYDRLLAGLPLILPFEHGQGQHVYHQYTLRSPQRDAIRAALAAEDIASVAYYPLPCHLQPPFLRPDPPALPEAERAAAEVLSLPIFPEIGEAQQAQVAAVIRAVLG